MSIRRMKALLAELGEEASRHLQPPAEPRAVMAGFCRAMSVLRERPITLVFRAFPDGIPVSGMRLDCGDRSVIVVEDRTPAESQLVILGHELWHEEQGDCGHHVAGLSAAAARALGPGQTTATVRQAAEQVLAAHEVPRDTLLAIAARSGSALDHEQDAETFGLLFGREVRTWIPGRYAQGPVSSTTLEGRIRLSLLNRGGQILR
ncbi:toxin [Streptomyces sp. NBC_00820]|uniref:toxin n=1 Tax=Streptomyces sp. NBC_00820 TaxID=2975842 RepID=UPI002ED1576B|nr:toxin [Streptomyces sp. NBC_00820]